MSAPTEAQRAFCERIGWEFWGLVQAVDQLGWEAPSSSLPYVRGLRSPIVDLVLWQGGDEREREAARERLIGCLDEWRPVLHGGISDALGSQSRQRKGKGRAA